MTTPTPEEIAKMAAGAAGSDPKPVKTITDLRLEQMEAKWEAKFNEILKINEELRAANKELYAVASAAKAAEPATAAEPAPSNTTVSAAVVGQPTAAEIAAQQKAREDALLAGVISEMGYRPKEIPNATPKVQDWM